MAYSGMAYPSPVGNQFYAAPVEIWESLTVFRGLLPGLFCPLHTAAGLTDSAVITDIAEIPGRSVMINQGQHPAGPIAIAVDITGPWR